MNKLIMSALEERGFHQAENELEQIKIIQQLFAETYTFENLDVLLNNQRMIDEHYLTDKLFRQKRGGLCYELNGALYLGLRERGFKVNLVSGTMWSEKNNSWILDETHIVALYYDGDQVYVIDSGSGANIPLQPIPLDQDPVQSPAGIFRARTKSTERGTMVLEKKDENSWSLRYVFHPGRVDLHDDLNRIKKMIHDDPGSPFNKELLITKIMPDGTVSINENRLSRKYINENGLVESEERTEFHNNDDLLQAIKKYASESTYDAAKAYLSSSTHKTG